jgi:hypothetical protein
VTILGAIFGAIGGWTAPILHDIGQYYFAELQAEIQASTREAEAKAAKEAREAELEEAKEAAEAQIKYIQGQSLIPTIDIAHMACELAHVSEDVLNGKSPNLSRAHGQAISARLAHAVSEIDRLAVKMNDLIEQKHIFERDDPEGYAAARARMQDLADSAAEFADFPTDGDLKYVGRIHDAALFIVKSVGNDMPEGVKCDIVMPK